MCLLPKCPQWPALGWAQCWKPGTQSRSPTRVSGTQLLDLQLLPSRSSLVERGWQQPEPDSKPRYSDGDMDILTDSLHVCHRMLIFEDENTVLRTAQGSEISEFRDMPSLLNQDWVLALIVLNVYYLGCIHSLGQLHLVCSAHRWVSVQVYLPRVSLAWFCLPSVVVWIIRLSLRVS